MKLLLVLFSGLSFIFYGGLILFSNHMRSEFQRYKLAQFRTLTGALELLGGIGLLVGLLYHPLLIISSAGLATLMLLGSIVRIRVKDRVWEIMPAIVLMVINFFILYQSL